MEKIKTIWINDLFPFPENPYQVREDEALKALAESIQDFGVISPLVVRPREAGGYEVIAGHRRLKASEQAGLEAVPAYVRDLDRDAAVIALVDSNLQRESLLPSEKARAYQLKLEAVKHQGATCGQVVHKSRDWVAEDSDSGRQVQRYIRLTKLIAPLLALVDSGKVAFGPAVELSYLAEKEQIMLLEMMESEERSPSLSQAQRLRKLSGAKDLDMDAVFCIMREEKPNEKEQIKLKKDSIRRYFPKGYTVGQMEQIILKLLAAWQKKREQDRASR